MAPRGTAARMAPADLPEQRDPCPRCAAGYVMRLGRLLVCNRLACDYEAPRFNRLQELPRLEPNRIDGARCSDQLARRTLEHLRAHPWSTAVEVAAAIERSAELARTIMLRATCQRRKRAGKGAPYEYALPDAPPTEQAGPVPDAFAPAREARERDLAAERDRESAELLQALADGPRTLRQIARHTGLKPHRASVLLRRMGQVAACRIGGRSAYALREEAIAC